MVAPAVVVDWGGYLSCWVGVRGPELFILGALHIILVLGWRVLWWVIIWVKGCWVVVIAWLQGRWVVVVCCQVWLDRRVIIWGCCVRIMAGERLDRGGA